MVVLMENQTTGWAIPSFADHVKRGQDATLTANMIALAWEGIDEVMQLIIGKSGFNALFSRSVEVTGRSYPWLATLPHDGQFVVDFTAFRALLTEQDAIEFAAANDALLLHFFNMLVELIGLSLTSRLLRPVLDPLLKV